MKVIVFGAGGATGAHLVRRAQERGHAVTAFVRNRSAPALEGVTSVHGDARDAAAVSAAIEGQDAVLDALGSGTLGKSDLLDESSRHLIAAMERHGPRRLIVLSAAGTLHDAGLRQGAVARAALHILKATLLRNVARDQAAQERHIEASSLDYTIVRPPFLTNGAATGRYRVALDGLPAKAGPIARADVAAFMVDQLEDASFIRQGPYLAT